MVRDEAERSRPSITTDTTPTKKVFTPWATLVVVALMVRILFLALFFDKPPNGDYRWYSSIAKNILHGHWYYRSYPDRPEFAYTPGYPIFISLVFAACGHSFTAVRIVQSVVSAFGVFPAFFIGKSRNRTAGWLVAWGYALYPMFALITVSGYSESLYIPLLLVFCALLLRMFRHFTFRDAALAGGAIGFLNMVRPVLIYFPFFLLPAFVFSTRRRMFRLVTLFTVFVVSMFLVMTPWAVRNAVQMGQFTYGTFHSGNTLWIGTIPSCWKAGGLFSEEQRAQASELIDRSAVVQNRNFTRAAIERVLSDPTGYLSHLPEKIILMWYRSETLGGEAERGFAILQFTLLAAAILGFLIWLRSGRHPPEFAALAALAVYVVLLTSLTYPLARYSLPAMVPVIVFASCGAAQLLGRRFVKKREELSR